MLFSSLEFLFVFFPVVLAVNFILPQKVRNYWLLTASLFFYAWGEPTFFLLLIISIMVNYGFGLLLDHLSPAGGEIPDNILSESNRKKLRPASPGKWKKGLFILALILNFLPLFVYKYLNSITHTLRTAIPAWKGAIPQTSFVLPLAISFYTFQAVSYVIDVYRGMPAEKNPCYYALYITFFPQLLQGPIIRYNDLRPQLSERKISFEGFSEGIIRFLTGLNQKVLLADILSEAVDAAFGAKKLSAGMAWLGMLAYSLQLYFDFSGYSDMAIGLGKMFGFRFAENFDFPYQSKSFTEFWRRWHISLGTWFRDYLYFPLGGSRDRSKISIVLNLMTVWLATGLWHGAEPTFILWGALHGIIIVMEKWLDLPERIEKKTIPEILYRAVVLIIASYGWMLFHSANFCQAITYTKALFRIDGKPWRDNLFILNSREYIVTFFFGVICAFPICRKLRNRISACSPAASSVVRMAWFLLQMVLAVTSVSCLVMSSHNPFLYMNY